MASVPTNSTSSGFQQSVAPDAAIAPYQNTSASADMFGAGVGQALQGMGGAFGKMGDVLEKHAVKLQELNNEAAATQADTEAAQRMSDYMVKFNQSMGADAMKEWGENGQGFRQNMDKIYSDVSGTLQNDEQRRQFNQRWQRTSQSMFTHAASHVAQQNRVYLSATADASASAATDAAMVDPKNDNLFLSQMKTVEDAAFQKARVMGLDGNLDAVRQIYQQYTDKAWAQRLQLVAQTDAPLAQQMLEKAVRGEYKAEIPDGKGGVVMASVGRMSGEMAGQLRNSLWGKEQEQNAAAIASDIYTKGTVQRSPGSATGIGDSIHQQESGRKPGDYQIQPGTWDQYAKQGESPDNPADQKAVFDRIIDDLHKKAGGDPARIAVGYFSGPGNIAGPDSPTPWKEDRADKNGKTVSSYVSDVTGRLASSPPPRPMTESQMAQANAKAMLEEVKARTAGNPELQERAVNALNAKISASIHAQNLSDNANENTVATALNGTKAGSPKSLSDLRAMGPDISQAYDALVQSKPGAMDWVTARLEHNSKGASVTTTPDTAREVDRLVGMSLDPKQREAFMAMDLPSLYGTLPSSDVDHLRKIKTSIMADDAAEREKGTDVVKALGWLKNDTEALNESEMNVFSGRMAREMEQYRADNNGKRPDQTWVLNTGRSLLTSGQIKGTGFFSEDKSKRFMAEQSGQGDQFYVPAKSIPVAERNGMSAAWKASYGEVPSDDVLSYWATTKARADQIPAKDRANIVSAYQAANNGKSPPDDVVSMMYVAKKMQQAKTQAPAPVAPAPSPAPAPTPAPAPAPMPAPVKAAAETPAPAKAEQDGPSFRDRVNQALTFDISPGRPAHLAHLPSIEDVGASLKSGLKVDLKKYRGNQ